MSRLMLAGLLAHLLLVGACANGGVGTKDDAGAQADAAPLPHCSDNVLSADESDIDCGGAECPRCDLGDDCGDGTDCVSQVCTLSLCACPEGFAPTGSTSCEDIDECTAGTDDCDPTALCTNTEGGFTCDCPLGYEGDGTGCTDVDECLAGTDDCSANATCSNLPGSFLCECLPGFDGDGRTCTDVDECTNGTAGCGANATCTNTPPGSFTCTCDPGYSGDGYTCSGGCAALSDPAAGALAACQAVFPNCDTSGYLGIIGWSDASCMGCNCDPVTEWQIFCFATGIDTWDCGPCELGRIRSAHTVSCDCNAGSTSYIGTWCAL